MFFDDGPRRPSERESIPDLLEHYRKRQQGLAAQARELEQMREQLSVIAEREAAAIVDAARHDVRRAVVDARQKILHLVEQLRAAGCEPEATSLIEGIFPSESHISTEKILSSSRKDVREVLAEARSDLVTLSGEAKGVRAQVAELVAATRVSITRAVPPSPPRLAAVARPTPAHPPPAHSSIAHAAPSIAAEPAVDSTVEPQPAPPLYTTLSASPRVWMIFTAVIALVALLLVILLSRGGSSPHAPPPQAAPSRSSSTGPEPGNAASPVGSATSSQPRASLVNTSAASRPVLPRSAPLAAGVASSRDASKPALEVASARVPDTVPQADVPAAAPSAAVPTSGSSTSVLVQEGTAGRGSPTERDVVRTSQQWLEAYFGADSTAMGQLETDDFSIADERSGSQRLPSGASEIRRTLDQVRVDMAASGAVLSARLTERGTVAGQARQHTSMVSQVYIRSDGRWQLMGVRIVDAANLASVPR